MDAAKGLAKVHFQDDDVPSGWLPMSVQKSLKDKYSFPFDVNEHVWFMDITRIKHVSPKR